MKRLLTLSRIAIVACVVIAGTIACNSVSKQSADITKEPIQIGVVLPLTGIAQFHGNNAKDGFDLAAKDINGKGGINGQLIKLIYENDNTESRNTISAVQKLININKVQAILGISWDFLANAVIPILDREKIVAISPTVEGDTLTEKSEYFFTTYPPIKSQLEQTKNFLNKEILPGSRAAILSVNNPWGLAYLKMYKQAVEETGNALIKEIVLPEFDNNDLQTDLVSIKTALPDIILVCLNQGDAALFARKIRELGISAKILINQNFADALADKIVSFETADGFYISRYSTPTSDFIKQYKEAYNKEPLESTDTAYDGLHILARAIRNVGYDAKKIKDELHRIELDGASGKISFNKENNSTAKESVLLVIKNGKFLSYED